MAHEADIQARMQRMVARDRNGANALILLSCLILFPDKFQGAVAPAVAPENMSREECKGAFASLRSWGFLQKEPHRWYWFDESLRQVISPHPETIAQLYKHYARRYKSLQTPRKRWSSLEWFNLQLDIQALHWGFDHDTEPEISLGLFLMQEYSIPDDQKFQLLEKAYRAADQLVTPQAQAEAFRNISFIARRIHHYEIGYKACEHALKLYKQLEDMDQQMTIFSILGELAEDNKDYVLAHTCYKAIIDYYNTVEDTEIYRWSFSLHVAAFISLGRVAGQQGDPQTAIDCFRQASHRMHRYTAWDQPLQLLKIAKSAHAIRQFDFARASYGWALHVSQNNNNFKLAFEILEQWGQLEQESGNPMAAKKLWLLMVTTIQQLTDRNLEAHVNYEYRESLEAKMDELREKYGLMDCGANPDDA